MDSQPAPDVLVVGGGFGGLYAARTAAHHGLAVTLVDANGYQAFQPLLYQAATGLLPQDVIRFDLSEAHGIDAVTGSVTSVNLAGPSVTLADGRVLSASALVLATGARVDYFGVPGAQEHALPLYTADDAAAIKARLQHLVEAAGSLDVVVVGAGATGVEVTGAICDVIATVLPRTYPQFAGESATVHLVDNGSAPLAHMSEKSQAYAARVLADSQVRIHFGRSVAEVTSGSVRLDDGSVLDSGLTIWAGGLAARAPEMNPAPATTAGGRVAVGPDLRLPGHARVYVIGDVAADSREPLPQLGSVAKQQGVHVGHSLARQHRGAEPEPFAYKDMGDMAMIRAGRAVVEMGSKHDEVEGDAAFTMWLGLHAALLPSAGHRHQAVEDWIHEMRTGTSRFLRS